MRYALVLLLLIFLPLASTEYNLSIVSVFQDEAKFLPEWIEYHQEQGVEHFWLYNYKSKDDYEIILQPYIENGLVELIEWKPKEWEPKKENSDWDKLAAYQDAIKKNKRNTVWLAIVDPDEFIITNGYINLNVLLNNNKEYSRITIACLNFMEYIQSPNENVPLIYSIKIRAKQNNPITGLNKSVIQIEKM